MTTIPPRAALSRETIKYIAMAAMLLNHTANIFLTPGTFLCELFLDIGYFTAVTMCYFLVEGYHYTSSPRRYAGRLLAFAAISQAPYCLAFTKGGVMEFTGVSMMFTLLACFLILAVCDRVENRLLRALAVLALTLATVFSDWPVLAPVFTLLFMRSWGDREKTRNSFLAIVPVFWLFDYLNRAGTVPAGQNALLSLGAACGVALSGLCIVYFYSGRRGKHTGPFSKWFFYIFYPAHLLILGLIRLAAG